MNTLQTQSKKITSDDAFKLDSEIKQLKKGINGGFIEIASRLKIVRDNKLYKKLDYDTFEGYIAQPELGFDRSSVFRLISIYEKFVIELRVAPGRLSMIEWTKLREILPFVNEQNKEEFLAKAKELSRSDLIEEVKDLKPQPQPLLPAQGKYQVIAIDPPWPYGTEFDAQTRRVASPYKELSIEKLADFTLPADDNCVLWLWTTHKFLFDSFHLMKIWEFEYKLTLVWDKQKMGMGAWLRCQAEFCLLGIKGKPKWELTNQRDFISAPRREHSRKPDEFYKLAETLWPEAKRIDIFSREKRPGWEQYGNEPNKLE